MTVLTEDQVLETLSSQTNLNDFLDAANVILLSGIKQFLPQLFINNDEDIREFAVKPLLAKSGPLDNIDVSLRLIYALGKIKKSVYADILLFSQMDEHLKTNLEIVEFHEERVYEFIQNLRCVTGNLLMFQSIEKMKFAGFEIFNNARYGNLVRTALSLAVTDLLKELTYERNADD
ncbi:transcriptional regulator [Enterobacteriaceae bacterium Kacie_13]|nr:transcriptional regulator [Enterobacteriaceae bacterium Kacie_13]